jgi:hypothetical protein
MGLLIVGTAFLAGLCISWWARSVSAPEESLPPAAPTTVGLVGFPHRVDPLASLDGARALTRRADLHGIAAWGVQSDGTVDTAVGGHRVRYAFASARGEGPQPPRPPGTLPKRAFCGRQNVHVKTEGMVADPDQVTAVCLPQNSEPLPTPRCGPKQLWQVALRRGAPPDRQANIEYFRAGAGPAWRFSIPGTPQTFVLYGDCVRELTGADAFGSAP